MFGNNKPRIGQELLDVPMGDMIRQMAFAIAEAQIVLDKNSIDVAEMMGGLTTVTDDAGNITFEDSRVYFGTAKMTKAEAIELHNGTSNIKQKAEIRAQLSNITPVYESGFIVTNPEATNGLADGEYGIHEGVFYVKTGGVTTAVPAANFTIALSSGTGTDVVSIPRRISMLECGFTPTFYQFVDTIIEVKISIKYTQEGTMNSAIATNNKSTAARIGLGFGRVKIGRSVQTSQVNAAYSQKYSYSAEGSSLLRTKLAVVPPPAVLEQRIQLLLEQESGS
jgi:hypothetical protein